LGYLLATSTKIANRVMTFNPPGPFSRDDH